MTNLYIEPFLGEFGYELMGWQSVLRALSLDTPDKKLVVWCRPGHSYLYSDFAEVHLFDPGVIESNCDARIGGSEFVRPCDGEWLTVKDIYVNGWKSAFDGSLSHEFIQFGFGRPGDPSATLVHARNTNKYNTGYRNWPLEHWIELVGGLSGQVASIGTEDAAHHVPGTVDLRGRTLVELCDIMAASPLVIGPTSGPIHLAALCKTPHVVWTGHRRTLQRCNNEWNPLKTEVIVYHNKFEWDAGEIWQPKPSEIIEEVRKLDASLVRS